jgi:predicted Zn-dependent protease
MPSHLAPTIHEIAVHAIELDRIKGCEANCRQRLPPSAISASSYGLKPFNISGDKQRPAAHVGCDDDGVKTTKF